MTHKIKDRFKSLVQTVKIIQYARLPTSMLARQNSAYSDRRTYNSYIGMTRVKFKGNTIILKIRVPEGAITFDISDTKVQQIVQHIKLMNPEYVFSAPEYKDIYYIEVKGTKLD